MKGKIGDLFDEALVILCKRSDHDLRALLANFLRDPWQAFGNEMDV